MYVQLSFILDGLRSGVKYIHAPPTFKSILFILRIKEQKVHLLFKCFVLFLALKLNVSSLARPDTG